MIPTPVQQFAAVVRDNLEEGAFYGYCGYLAFVALDALLVRLDALEEVADAADMIHAHGPGAPTRQPESCPLCAALARLLEAKA